MLRPTVEWPSAFAREDGGGRQRSDPLRAWNLRRIAKGLRRWAAKRKQKAHILNKRPKTRALQTPSIPCESDVRGDQERRHQHPTTRSACAADNPGDTPMLRHGGCHGRDNILRRALIKRIGTRQRRAAGHLVAAPLSVTVNLRLHGEHRWQAVVQEPAGQQA